MPSDKDKKEEKKKDVVFVFTKNVYFGGKNYLTETEVPEKLLKEDYIKQYITAKVNV